MGRGFDPHGAHPNDRTPSIRCQHRDRRGSSLLLRATRGSPLEAAAECLFKGNASVLPRGEDPSNQIGSDSEDRKQE